GEKLLPTGRWREPRIAIARAHAACIQGTTLLEVPIPQFAVNLEADLSPLERWRGQAITAFAGIAKPERFFSTLKTLGLEIHRQITFPDHHNYSNEDLKELGDGIILTTEKDFVKLEGRGNFVAIRVSANIADFERLRQLIVQRINLS